MEYFDVNSIKPVESAILSLRNYILYLYENNEEIRKSIRDINKFKEDLKNIKEKLEIDKHIKSIEYARRMKEFGLIADMLNIEYEQILDNKKYFPIFACLNNSNNEEIYVLIYDITNDGIKVKNKNNDFNLITKRDFKKVYKNRIFYISDFKPLMKKYNILPKDYKSYTSNKLFQFDDITGRDIAELCCAIIQILDEIK